MEVSALKKILFVDDDINIQNLVAMSLEDIGGYELIVCGSGDEALKVIKDYHPDLFLLDVAMPGIQGTELLVELRKIPEFAETPAIFLTRKIKSQEVLNYSQFNILGVIAKPFDPVSLPDLIQSLWKSRYFELKKNPKKSKRSYKNKISL